MRVTALSLLLAASALAQSEDVVTFFRTVAATLAEAHDSDGNGRPDARPFLENFDPNMPGYSQLRDEIETLVTAAEVGSSVEILSDAGDENKRVLQLDWILEIQDRPTRRQIVRCTIAREKKEWKITALEPVDFFKY